MIIYSNKWKITMLFLLQYAIDYSSYRFDLLLDKYLFHISNLILIV